MTSRPPIVHPNAWAAIADLLARHGVDTVFALPGDDMAALTAVEGLPIRLVLVRDQRNAVFMATGYALATGRAGAVFIGKGPAVANAVTGLLEAQAARVPVLLFAAGTADAHLGTGAFQELDQLAVVRPVTKYAVRITGADRVGAVIDRAMLVARSGAPGPVYVELPEPVGAAPVPTRAAPLGEIPPPAAPAAAGLAASVARLADATRPLILVGGGTRHRAGDRLVERLAERLGAGIFATASGRGVVDEDDPAFCGLAGLYTLPSLRGLWDHTDLVIALGSRLEETATFGWPDPAPPVLQVNIDAAEVATERPGSIVLGDVAATLHGWLETLPERAPSPWRARVEQDRGAALAEAAAAPADRDGRPTVAGVLAALDRCVPADRVVVQENGLQDMWSYFFPYWRCGGAAGAVVPSEQTSLGFGAAAAVGVACAQPGRPVVAIVGDGAFHLFRSELPTVADAGVAVLYVVLDNGGYGWLQKNLESVAPSSGHRFTAPDRATGTAGLASAYGLHYVRVDKAPELEPALRSAWQACAGQQAAIVEIGVDLTDTPPGIDELAGDFPEING